MTILTTFRLTEDQRRAATEARDLALVAGAGSGKTNTLTARYLDLVEHQRSPRRIVAITFTEKATREMRQRIRRHIQMWIAEGCPAHERAAWQEIEADLDGARIGTIHSLCAEILRAHPAEAAIDPHFQVLDEGAAATLTAASVQAGLAWATEEKELAALFQSVGASKLEDILTDLLHRRLEAESAFARGPETWDAALCDNMRAFLNLSPIRADIQTLRALQTNGELLDDAGEKLTAQVDALLEQWMALESALASSDAVSAADIFYRVRREHLGGQTGGKKSQAKQCVSELRNCYDEQLNGWLGGKNAKDVRHNPAFDTRARELVSLLRRLFEHTCAEYRRSKNMRGALDFDDMEAGAQQLLRRPEIRAYWQAQLDALLIDEFQDTNERQREIIQALAGTTQGRLFVVGDPKQSIYRFRGADVTVFESVRQDITRAGGASQELSQTFRAHGELVNAMNELLAGVLDSPEPRGPYYTPFAPLQAMRADVPTFPGSYIEFLYGTGPQPRRAAASLLTARLRELHDGGFFHWEQVACLFRASTGFDTYEQALADGGIPFVTVAGGGFYERAEIRDLLNILRALSEPENDAALAGLLRSPAFALSDAALYQLRWSNGNTPHSYFAALAGDLTPLADTDRVAAELARARLQTLTNLVGRITVAELLKAVLTETCYLAIITAVTGERLERNVDKLLADAYAGGMTGVSEFLEYVETLRDVGVRQGEAPSAAQGAVRLMTVHKAKGLEFPLVVLADAARLRPSVKGNVLLSEELGVVPRVEDDTGKSLYFHLARQFEEDRENAQDLRLLYVAATRARDKLIVCAHESANKNEWFHKLTDAAHLDPDELAAAPNEWHTRTLEKSHRSVSFFTTAEPPFSTPPAPTAAHTATLSAPPLYEPLPQPQALEQSDAVPSLEALLQDTSLQTAVGDLFHASIREWCFPDNPRLDALLRAAASDFGLTSDESAQGRVRELLHRIQNDARFAEMDAAPVRRHEAPYLFAQDAHFFSGTLDLLYQTPDGSWHIVDFKTDSLASRDEALALVKAKYGAQLFRYQQAALRANIKADAWLCFVDCGGGVLWHQT